MKFQFNTAQLSSPQRINLLTVLDVIQSENDNEIEVMPVEFPIKLKVKLDDDIELLLGWDVDKQSYAGLTKPEPEPDPIPESQKDTVDIPEPLPELAKSEVGKRVEALARALINLAKPFDSNVRIEMWSAFCKVLFKEYLE